MSDESKNVDAERTVRVQLLVDDCIRRMAGGEKLDDEAMIAAHPELMPELRDKLRALSLVRVAMEHADEPAAHEHGDAHRTGAPAAAAPYGDPPAVHANEQLPPDAIPGYEIIGEVHRGGQGVVYQAIQKSTHRKVAIKVMREGPFASPGERARFEREVQVLAALKHPNIVAVHESGSHGGAYYFVMDYISGKSLDEWIAQFATRFAADRSTGGRSDAGAAAGASGVATGPRSQRSGGTKARIDEALRLFAKICDAVSAAHVRGIIHRDLKPGNIRIDADVEPHILDFGLAKVATGDLGGGAMTMTGQFVGSLPWASPEQAEGAPDRVDMRTDVYSLGVILYQMLTQRFPYEVVGRLRDVLDNILKAEPARPSTIRRQINDEVETIVLKCLSKERERRYQSAGDLGRDIRRYLAGEPIEAKRDSFGYVLRKQIRRYKLPAAVASAFALSILGGLIASLTFWRQAAHERDAAVAARVAEERERRSAEQARQAESEQRRLAEKHADDARVAARRAETAKNFLANVLVSSDPELVGTRDMTVRELLDRAAGTLESDPINSEPAIAAEMRGIIGRTYENLGLYERAEAHLREALRLWHALVGDDHEATIGARADLAAALSDGTHYDEAEQLLSDAVGSARRMFPDGHEVLARAISSRANLELERGMLAQAEESYREALSESRRALPPGHINIGLALAHLGEALVARRKLAEAEPLLREALTQLRAAVGDEHPFVGGVLDRLGSLLLDRGNLADAEVAARDSLAIRRRHYPADHPTIAKAVNNLAMIYLTGGRFAEAEPLFHEALGIYRRRGEGRHPTAGAILSNLGELARQRGDPTAAEPLLREALDVQRSIHGPDYPYVGVISNNLALTLLELGADPKKLDEAEALFADTLRNIKANFGEEHPYVASTLHNVGLVRYRRGDFEGALKLLNEALSMRRRVLGENTWEVANSLANIAHLHAEQSDLAGAAKYLRQTLDVLRALVPINQRTLAERMTELADVLRRSGQVAEAAQLARDALRIIAEHVPDDVPGRGEATSVLGACLAGDAPDAEAERLLLDGYQTLVAAPLASFNSRRDAIRRILAVYSRWNRAADADEWRNRLAELHATTQPASAP